MICHWEFSVFLVIWDCCELIWEIDANTETCTQESGVANEETNDRGILGRAVFEIAAQQQQIDQNNHTSKHLAFNFWKLFFWWFAKIAASWKLLVWILSTPRWQQIAFGKILPKSCQGLSNFSRARCRHRRHVNLFVFGLRIQDCQIVVNLVSHNRTFFACISRL